MARKILLADDSVTAQNMGRKILSDAGYEVIAVNNGSAALKRIAEQRPDLIVLDVYMPGYSGLEVCQRLKETNETARIPVLLTVGKLEPFKPEEAKRVRADAFIVKPFEASELLSALTKLEDKIVPVSEGSKPGRFARAIAAVEEGRYDRTVAGEEDSGWKNRISFPSKKKDKASEKAQKEEKEESDDSAIYNPVNKDLRTVVDRKPAQKQEAKSDDARVDLGALAPEGLPKDVTPEEIAALAAAAARVADAFGEAKTPESAPESAISASADAVSAALGSPGAASAEAKPEAATETVHPPLDSLKEDSPKEDSPKEIAATFAEQNLQEEKKQSEIKPVIEQPAEVAKESLAAPDSIGIAAANNAHEIASATEPNTNSAKGSDAGAHEIPVAEPVTMAMARGAESASAAQRWTAVSITPAPEEIGISLEQEMRKAFAAFAAADAAQARVTSIAGSSIAGSSIEGSFAAAQSIQERATVETSPSAFAATEPVQTIHAEASATTAAAEAVAVVTKEFEKVATSGLQVQPVYGEPESVPAAAESATHSDFGTAAIENIGGESPVAPFSIVKPDAAQVEVSRPELQAPAVQEVPQGKEAPQEKVEAPPASPIPDVRLPSEVSEAVVSGPFTSGSKGDKENKESDIAATTAAAWASWRRIRGVGESNNETPEDNAAMAVAAGAEKAPEDVESESGDIANIVDSVLADLRPKIVEEISRKLGKKK